MNTKYIFISGGLISGLGKGVTTAATAFLLKAHGFKVSPVKCDPYLNVDAGTMNPVIHGETFVTEDGLETDQDLGHYERFLNVNLSRLSYMTSGQVYLTVIQRERELKYGGKCVETIPHIPEEIIRRLKELEKKEKPDFIIAEIGGTVGEYQNMMFLEAAKELKYRQPKDVLNIHVAYLPLPPSLGELKSKPAQISVMLLNERGIFPDLLIGRAVKHLDNWRREKIATLCNIAPEDIFSNPDVGSIYEVPLILLEQNIVARILKKLKIKRIFNNNKKNNLLSLWKDFVNKIKSANKKIKIGIVGKYFRSGDFSLEDSYICVIEALKQASYWNGFKAEINWIDSADVEKENSVLQSFDGLVVPQGWGSRGIEGKIETAKYARINKIPFLGLCFGMQLACVEFARNVCGLKDANTQEADKKTKNPVIHIMPDQEKYLLKHQYGGTIRLGAWPCRLKEGTKIYEIYKNSKFHPSISLRTIPKSTLIYERHRHRYEFNNKYREIFQKNGMIISGTSPDDKLVESVELKDHPFFIGTQFHPEFKSRALSPHPLFLAFIAACAKKRAMIK